MGASHDEGNRMDPCPGFSADEAVPIGYLHMLKLRTERKQCERKEVAFFLLTLFLQGAERQRMTQKETIISSRKWDGAA